jgi:predicted outer membrane repeat protein
MQMKTLYKHLIKVLSLLIFLLCWWDLAWAAYPSAPTITTSGSAAYTPIATAINSWKNAWTAPANASSTTSAFAHRSDIIDQVEATLLAAGQDAITDAEYDRLADALYFWLHQVASEGRNPGDGGVYGNNRAGWYISGIGIPEWFFGKQANSTADYNNSQCVWELQTTSCQIAGSGTNGYGPMLGSGTRMVLFVKDGVAETTIFRNTDKCNVMFSTNGVNSKLLILGRKNNKVRIKGSQSWSDPTSYQNVLDRSVASGQRGQLVEVNGGSLMTAYTTFDQNITIASKCSYRHYATNPPGVDANNSIVEGTGGTNITSSDGGAIGVTGDMNCCSFYYSNIKNNATSEDSKFGGGICFRGISAKTSGTNGNIYFNHCTIKGNRNNSHGGGVALYFNDAADGRNVYLKDTEISYNCQASALEAHGGGLWVVNKYDSDLAKQRKVYFDGCTFTGNYAHGLTAAGGAISNEGTIILENSAFNNNVADNSFGGAIYNRPQMAEGATKGVDLTVSGCSFTGNRCTWTGDLSDGNNPNSNPTRGCGGAIMIDIFRLASYPASENYVIQLDIEDNCTFTNNHADRSGGAIAVAACRDMESWMDNPPSGHGTLTSNMEIKSATMTGNTAGKSGVTWPTGRGNYGGAVYLSYTDLSVTGNSSNIQIKNNGNVNGHTATQYGGAVAIYKGDLSLSGGTFGASGNGNKATYGGAFYINQGTVSLGGGSIGYNTATEQGGGLYTTGNGTISVSGVTINNNTAKAGGGIYTNNSSATNFNMTNGTISNNSATAGNGGGVCLDDRTTLKLSTGTISGNSASANGGGVYLGANAALQLSGAGAITGNSVTSGLGGGVYMGGAMTADGTSLNVSGNTKSRSVNNVYLPHNKKIAVGSSISPNVTLGIYTEKTVDTNNGNDIPVLTGSSTKLLEIYSAMTNGQSNIRDDRGIHKAKYTTGDGILYFGKVMFDYPAYTSDFSNPIDSKAKLYQFMCWVNGVNGYGDKHSDATGNVTADIDMTGIQYWIPIGEHNVISSTTPYIGSFNGNGHIISNLSFNDGLVEDWGVFGSIDNGAVLTDVFVQGVNFATKSTQGSIGSLVGDMKGGTVKNCGGAGTLTTTHTDCVIGGLVGIQEGGTIHSCFATADMTGYQMGGLVGFNSSNLYNSFANGKFHNSGLGYVGGLVGVNTGTVENCYSREQSGSSHGSNFAWLAGANQRTVSGVTTKGNLNYSYAPSTPYTALYVEGNQTGLSTYGTTSTPYSYMHADNQVVSVAGNSYITNGALDRNGLKGLLATLNKWVGNSSTYSKWMRTSASPINGDYPIHNYSDYVCVGSKDNIFLEYNANFNTKFGEYITANTGTLYLYNSPTADVTSTLSNSSGVPALYIHEDVVMMHSSAIKAHVGITLDNSAGTNGANPSFGGSDAIDWHFFSSALADAPIGLVYGDQSQYNLGVYPAWHAYFNNANGYFPTNLNDVVGGDDYYNHWDLFGYCEPDYHWINYKRNSASHWHEDWPDIHITYTNDTEFVPGRGYMVALKNEGYLQGYGTLNTNSGNYITVPVTCTSSIGWTTREGHNLLGNPYQSYLDFDAFASDQNNATLWNNRRPFYIIIDEEKKDYVLYTVGQSLNSDLASRFLHPHQGFMIDVDGNGTARFSNAMRTTTTTVTTSGNSVTWPGDFRGGEVDYTPCYPLVNLKATDVNGNRDIVTVELGRPDTGGALKQDALRMGKGSLWCHYNDEDYALVFTQPGLEAANIRFAADEDTEFTMTWNTQNGEFSYLHLIDNIAGKDIDCLQQTEYTFTAKTTDYVSRFRLVFDYTGVEENGDNGTMIGSETFAYYANGEIHLTDAQADATLQIIDMLGRVIVSRDAVHTVSTSGMTPGVYVLRLTTANGTKTQKIVLN